MSDNDDSAGPDEPRTRRHRSVAAARAGTAAVTSRTAGWMVAAALGGSLVTLLLNHGASTPAAQQVAIRNTGNTAPAPRGRTRWRVISPQSAPRQVYLAPGNPAPPRQVYVAPGGPPAVSWIPAPPGNWTVVPGCVISRTGMLPFPPRRLHGMKAARHWRIIIGRVAKGRLAISHLAIGRPGRPGRVEIGRRPACSVIRLPHRVKVHDHG